MAAITAAAGGGNWTTGATWVGAVAPTAADDALLTVGSGNVTIDTGAVCRSLDCNTYTGTLTHGSAVVLTIGDGTAGAGNRALRLVAGMTYTLTANAGLTFVSTSATPQSVTTGTKAMPNLTFSGAGGSWQFADAVSATGTTITHTAGTLDTNGQTITGSNFTVSGATARTLTFGASAINLAGTSTTTFNAGTVTNLTVTANTATATLSGTTGGFSGSNQNWNGLTVSMTGTGSQTFACSGTVANLTRTGGASTSASLTLANNFTITGTFTATGNTAASNRLLITSDTTVVSRTITAAVVALTNTDFRDITGAGAASPFTGSSIGNCLGNTNITTTPAVNRFWVGNGGAWNSTTHWAATSGGATGASVPLPQDNVAFDANSFSSASQTVTRDMPRSGTNIDFTGVTNSPTFAPSGAWEYYGNLTFVSGMTYTLGTLSVLSNSRSNSTVTSAGNSFYSFTVNQTTANTTTFADALTCTDTTTGLDVRRGTSTFQGNVTVGILQAQSGNSKTVNMGSGTFTITGTTGTLWSLGASATVNAGTSTIVFATSASSRTFAGGGLAYNNLTYTAAGSTGALVITGANTFNVLAFSDASNARTLTLPASTTTTISTGFQVNGTSGKLMTVNSSTGGTAATLSKAGANVSCDYLSIQDSTATGGTGWYAGANSTNVSGNTGWIFTAAPAQGSTALLMGVG